MRFFILCLVTLPLVAGCKKSNSNDNNTNATCGDDQVAGNEVCDGADLAGFSCTTLGFTGGSLACSGTCDAFDASACNGVGCGDGNVTAGEVCDGANLAGSTCADHGFTGGTLACEPTCNAYDTSACTGAATCGDNLIEGNEVCDGPNLAGTTCISLGFDSGTLTCNSACNGFDSGACVGSGCGDNVIDTGETCDGTDLAGSTCQAQGFDGGTLGCSVFCDAFDTSQCTSLPACGDGVVDAGEVCDDGNTQGGDGCAGDCLSDESCGNGVVDTAAGETCDDSNTTDGDGCSGSCSLESCGDGTLDPGETCDDGNNVSGDGCSADCLSDESCGNGFCDNPAGETCVSCNQDCGACLPECADGVDNDGDGRIDWSPTPGQGDPDCTNPADDDESA